MSRGGLARIVGALGVAAMLAGALAGCRSAEPGPEDVVERALSDDESVRMEVLAELAAGRHPEAVPLLVERLGRPDANQITRAADALVAAGDERAIPALIDLSRRADPRLTVAIVKGIGRIGGRQAEAYLFTLETGSPREDVRDAAGQARKALERRRERVARENAADRAAPSGEPGVEAGAE